MHTLEGFHSLTNQTVQSIINANWVTTAIMNVVNLNFSSLMSFFVAGVILFILLYPYWLSSKFKKNYAQTKTYKLVTVGKLFTFGI